MSYRKGSDRSLQRLRLSPVSTSSKVPSYRADGETAFGGGGYVDEGNVPHESPNFLPVGDTYCGFVENR